MKKLRFLIIICFTSASYSQDTKNNQSLFLTFSGGTALNNPINYYFYREIDDQLINPGVHISLGVGYGSINFLELSQLYFNISLGYNKVSTSEFQLENVPSNAILIIETYPILLWSRLQTNTRLSPFIEIGFGVSKLNFIERYSKWLNGTSFSNWAFGYGFGAGLNYRFTENLDLALVVQSLSHEKEKIVKNDRDHKYGIVIRNIVVPISICVNYKF